MLITTQGRAFNAIICPGKFASGCYYLVGSTQNQEMVKGAEQSDLDCIGN